MGERLQPDQDLLDWEIEFVNTLKAAIEIFGEDFVSRMIREDPPDWVIKYQKKLLKKIEKDIGKDIEQIGREYRGNSHPVLPDPRSGGYPNLPDQLKVKPTSSSENDPHPPEYYEGNRGTGIPMRPEFQTNPSPNDIHPPGYHTGGPGPYMPPQFRVPKGPFGR